LQEANPGARGTVEAMARAATLVALAAVLAACDGGPSSGRVIDAVTGIGIFQIEVSCLDDGATVAQTRTGGSGEFSFADDVDCGSLRARDVDGPVNGSYREATAGGGGGIIRLTPL
jgi:hypothetical protein